MLFALKSVDRMRLYVDELDIFPD